MQVIERFHHVRKAKRRFENTIPEAAGRAAELQLLHRLEAWIDSAGSESNWRVWASVRLATANGATEIDFVVATDTHVFLLELKNWSGRLELAGNKLMQIKASRDQSVLHGDLMQKMRTRETSLRAWVERSNYDSPPIECLVLFDNPALTMSSPVRAYFGHESAFTSEWLEGLPDTSSMVLASSRTFWDRLRRRKPHRQRIELSPEMQNFHQAMDQLGTWDEIALYGGQRLFGDVVGGDSRVEFSTGLRARLSERRHFTGVDFEAPRSWFWLLFGRRPALKALAHLREGGTLVEKLPQSASIKFQIAGRQETRSFSLRNVLYIRYGYAGKVDRQRLR